LIQKSVCPDSIVVSSLLLVEFCNTIGGKADITLTGRCKGHGAEQAERVEHAMPSVLITGANRGIGLEFARQYLADGWQVYATCRHPGSASEPQHLAEVSDHNLRILALDVTNPETVKEAAAELDGQAIDLLLSTSSMKLWPGAVSG
jgi:hypothetical protein